MAGYGGQEIALDVNDTPIAAGVQSGLQAGQNYQLGQSRLQAGDLQNQETQLKLAQIPLETQEMQTRLGILNNQRSLSDMALSNHRIGMAMGSVDPNDPNASADWDTAMQKLVDSGDDEAKQYIGQYTPDRQKRLAAMYTADNPVNRLMAMGQSGVPAMDPTAEQSQVWDQQFAKATPEQLSGARAKYDSMVQALQQVAQSKNPAETWAQLAPQFGVDTPYSEAAFQQAAQHIVPLDTYLRNRDQQQQAGLPGPVVPGQLVHRLDGSIDRVDGAGNVTRISGPTTDLKVNPTTGETYDVHGGAEGQGTNASSGPTGAVYDQIGTYATQKLGATPQEAAALRRFAYVESRGNPNVGTNAANKTGLYQFDQKTFDNLGGGDITSLQDQTKNALALMRQNRGMLQNAGLDPSDEDSYVLHQQGAAEGLALIRTANQQPNVTAVDALTPVYQAAGKANPRAVALQAVTNNGGSADMTASQFVDKLRGQYDTAGGGPLTPGSQGAVNAGTTDPMVLEAAKSVQRMPPNMNAGQLEDKFQSQLIDGKLPNFGARAGALGRMTDAAYTDYKVARMQQLGLTEGDMHSSAAAYKALSSNLTKVSGMQSQIEASASTLNNNIKIAQGLLDKGGSVTDSPVLNRWIQGGRKAIAGDPDVIQLDGTLKLISSEAASMMTRTTGSGGSGTSDAARRDAEEILSGNYSKTALKGMFSVIQQEGAGRVQSYANQVESTRAAISGLTPHVQGQTPAADVAESSRWPGHTDAQLTAAQQYKGSKAPQGTNDNPFVINATGDTKAAVRTLINNHKPTPQNPLYVIDTSGHTWTFTNGG